MNLVQNPVRKPYPSVTLLLNLISSPDGHLWSHMADSLRESVPVIILLQIEIVSEELGSDGQDAVRLPRNWSVAEARRNERVTKREREEQCRRGYFYGDVQVYVRNCGVISTAGDSMRLIQLSDSMLVTDTAS